MDFALIGKNFNLTSICHPYCHSEGIIMEQEIKQRPTPEFMSEEIKVDINSDDSGNLVTYTEGTETNQQWQEVVDNVSSFLSNLPENLTSSFITYKRPIVVVGLVLGAIIAVKLTLAILDSVNDIPLLAPLLELIGLGYTSWFVYRYLLKASNRKELSDSFTSVKEQVVGRAKDFME